jgi:hypothetical protein
MNNLKAGEAASARVSWKDEISYSHDLNSEGLEQLKEAIKQAKASNAVSTGSAEPIRQS